MVDTRFESYKRQPWTVVTKRSRLSVLPNVYSMQAATTLSRQLLNGLGFQKIMLTFEQRDMHMAVDTPSLERLEQESAPFLLAHHDLFDRCIVEIQDLSREWLRLLKPLRSAGLTTISATALIALYRTYCQHYHEIYGRYFTILELERGLTAHLQEILHRKLPDRAATAFTQLTYAFDAMHTKHEERDRLQIAVIIADNPEWQALFAQSEPHIMAALPKFSELDQMIQYHTDQYFWITRDYEDPVLTKGDIVRMLHETLQQPELQARAEQLREEQTRSKAQISSWEQQLELTAPERQLFAMMRAGIRLKELRKSIVSQSLFYFDPVITEIGRRTNLPIALVRMLLFDELEPLLIQQKPFRDVLEQRYQKSVFVIEDGLVYYYQGQQADELFATVLNFDHNVDELRGIRAAAGVARGRARIVLHPNDLHKIQEGDIMVTVQAVPSFSIPLKKCKGLIADGGTGITSHSATLAREVGIPCVVQVKIGTEIIHDGDTVEVNGNEGVVRILEHA